MKDQEQLFSSEEKHKELVYKTFDQKSSEINKKIKNQETYIQSEAYEDQDSFVVHGALPLIKNKKSKLDHLIGKLYKKPYFVHLEIEVEEDQKREHYYLSDCEALDTEIEILGEGELLPFKKDPKRPMYSALFHSVQSNSSDIIEYIGNDKKNYRFSTKLICQDTIENRKLLNVYQQFPYQEQQDMEIDDFLAMKLQENINDPEFRNIIATLQQQQFSIIESDKTQNFIVQGCAGSGKSQCLFHRLFYLRDELSDIGWNRVILLTPTALFKSYSADLIKRYKLSNIKSCSLAELYKNLLDSFDDRFKNRQYKFELSEEYLSSEYLKKVYAVDTIQSISTKIAEAINFHLNEALNLLDEPLFYPSTPPSRIELAEKLNNKLEYCENNKKLTQNDSVLIMLKESRENVLDKLKSVERSLNNSAKTIEKLQKELFQIDEWSKMLKNNQQEKEELEKKQKKHLEESRQSVIKIKEFLDFNINNRLNEAILLQYAQRLDECFSIICGKKFTSYEQEKEFYNNEFNEITKKLNDLLNSQDPENAKKKRSKKLSENQKKQNDDYNKKKELENELSTIDFKITNRLQELNLIPSTILNEEKIRKAKNILVRLESTIFEKEVWNYLAQIKENFSIPKIHTEYFSKEKKELKILYKSDLLFYLMIYSKLNPLSKQLPDYKLFCIDEGQDLHKVDYDLLKELFPDATFNIFGDLNQVLHEDCGIQNWEKETGVNTIYTLNKNYRNTPEIVDFCNKEFQTTMEYIGKLNTKNIPISLENATQIQHLLKNEKEISIIVKDKKSYDQFCSMFNLSKNNISYLDSSSKQLSQKKISCYSIFAAKGLEFKSVLVYLPGMTKNQQVVACTRAMEKLYYIK